MKDLSFKARIVNGQLQISGDVSQLPDGEYTVVIGEPVNQSQRKYLFGVLYATVADKTGYDVLSIHNLYKAAFLSYDSELVDLGDAVVLDLPVLGSTTLITRQQLTRFIQDVEAHVINTYGGTKE